MPLLVQHADISPYEAELVTNASTAATAWDAVNRHYGQNKYKLQ